MKKTGFFFITCLFLTANIFAQDLTTSANLTGKVVSYVDEESEKTIWFSGVQGQQGEIFVGYTQLESVIPGTPPQDIYFMGVVVDWKDGNFALRFILINTGGSIGGWLSSNEWTTLASFRDGKWNQKLTQIGTSAAAMPGSRGDNDQEKIDYWTNHVNRGRRMGL